MNDVELKFGPRLYGGEILTALARNRGSATIDFSGQFPGIGRAPCQLVVVDGRPEMALFGEHERVAERGKVITVTRVLATTASGRGLLQGEVPLIRGGGGLAIDTLGEVLIALLRGLSGVQMDAFWDARSRVAVNASDDFAVLAETIEKLSGTHMEPPKGRTLAGSLILDASVDDQRAWAAQLLLGGLATAEPSPAAQVWSQFVEKPEQPLEEELDEELIEELAAAEEVQPSFTRPTDPKAAELFDRILRTHRRLDELNHYEFLGVESKADEATIRKKYFDAAKAWHQDAFAEVELPAEVLEMAADLFRRAEEAQKILSDPKEREAYDFVLDRKAKGLPTDPRVIMEAETLFRRAQTLVRRGQASAAEPLLRDAIALNPGEPEFQVYLGWAIYAAQGHDGRAEAIDWINKGLAVNERMASGHEFLGRIARAEGHLTEAHRELGRALELEPGNVEAQREMRMLRSRQGGNGEEGKKGLGGLFKKLF